MITFLILINLVSVSENQVEGFYEAMISARIQRQAKLVQPYLDEGMPLHIQRDAVRTLGQIGDPSAQPWFEKVWMDSKLHSEILFALGEMAYLFETESDGQDDAESKVSKWFFDSKRWKEHPVKWFEAFSKIQPASSPDSELMDLVWGAWSAFPAPAKEACLLYAWRLKDKRYTDWVLEQIGTENVSYGMSYYLSRARTPLNGASYLQLLRASSAQPFWLIKALACQFEPNPKIAEAVFPLLDHVDWRVRTEAVRVLGRLEVELGEGLIELQDPNPNVKRVALSHMLRSGQLLPEQERQILRRWKGLTPCLKHTVFQSLNSLETRWLELEWQSWLRTPDRWLRHKAIALAAKRKDKVDVFDQILEPLMAKGTSAEQVLALNVLVKERPQWLWYALESADPFLFSSGIDLLADVQIDWNGKEKELELKRITDHLKTLSEVQFFSLRGFEPVFGKECAQATWNDLLSSTNYLVRLKAAEALGLVDRSACFVTPFKTGLPPGAERSAGILAHTQPEIHWELQTEKGIVVIELKTGDAPVTCASIMSLSSQRYFDGMAIHRVVPNFVVQAGDPRGDGSGGPGYVIPCEINSLPFERGSVGMALAGKDTGGSQFFICHSSQHHLDGGYTVFGSVVQGMAVVDILEEKDVILKSTIKRISKKK